MNTYRTLIISIISLISLTVHATEQSPDRLIFKGDTIYIETYPLEILMNSDSLIHNKIFGYDTVLCISSGCWRGHIATWEISNDSLFLTNLIAGCDDYTFDLAWVFGDDKVKNDKVFADWFSGDLLEYQSWFIFLDEDNQDKKPDRFSCHIKSGLASNIIIDSSNLEENEKNELEIDTTIYLIVDTTPVLVTSDKTYEITELKQFIMENIKYPQNGADCMGSVFISFVVEMNGTISNKKYIRKLCEGYDEEAMKVIDLMTNWKPGILKGKPVRTRLTLPVRYRYE